MVNTRRTFLFHLMDMMSSRAFKERARGFIDKVNPFSQEECALPESPTNWEQIELSFAKGARYWTNVRSFSPALQFVGSGARILRSIKYQGKGTETNVMLCVSKWDPKTSVYMPYYMGQVNFLPDDDSVEGPITITTIDGGASAMIKAMEQAVFEIECDGSLPEHINLNADGILFDDVFHYVIQPVTNTGELSTLPATFTGNDGDNIGITRNDSIMYENMADVPNAGTYLKESSNFGFSSEIATNITIKGNITVRTTKPGVINFYLFTRSNLSEIIGGGPNDTHSYPLIAGINPRDPIQIQGQKVINFERTIPLEADERMFIFFAGGDADNHPQILGGQYDEAFKSRYRSSRVVGMSMWDLFRLLLARMYAKHVMSGAYPFQFDIQSDLLQVNLNLFVTSGDAVRASTDPNYGQYYNQATLNPDNPNNQDFNQFTSLGPVYKTHLQDYFDSVTALKNTCLGVKKVNGKDVIFLEKKKDIFNPDVITMTLSDVTNLKISIASEFYFNWIKAGYDDQKYDEKAGKFEYNSLNQWQPPIRSIVKTIELVSKYRADSYGFEYTRYNTQGGKSATYNGNDSSVWMTSINRNAFVMDFFSAFFKSQVPDPATDTNTNIVLTPKQAYQSVTMVKTDGKYFTRNMDFSIFMFNQPMAPTSYNTLVVINALLNGLAGDSATITMFLNGVALQAWSQSITGVNTALNVNISFAQIYNTGDSIYFAVDSVGTCTVDINLISINVGGGYWIANNAGSINIPASSTQKLVSLALVTATLVDGLPVVSSSFQYFRFLSNVMDKSFTWTFMMAGYHQGGGSEFVRFDLWKNGQKIGTDTFFGSGGRVQFNPLKFALFSGSLTFEINDIVWITATPTNLQVWITDGELRFTSKIRAYELDRPDFDSIVGVPNPETAFNIEPFTPRRIVKENSSLLSPIIYNQAPGSILFQTAAKNGFFTTAKDGEVICERANIDIHDLDTPLFLPFWLTFDTTVDSTFNELFEGQANGHIEVKYGNKTLYGFPWEVSSKPAYDESQSWKLLCSFRTNPADLVDLDWNGLIPLQPMDTLVPILSPLHFVPVDYQKEEGDDTFTMDEDWYKNRYADWLSNQDYFNPWEQADTISLQFQSYGLAPVKVQVLDGDGNALGNPINVPEIITTALPGEQKLYGVDLPLTDYLGFYYFVVTFGIGAGQAVWISEPIEVREKWPNTLRVKYTHSQNMQGVVFAEGYSPMFRVPGKIMRFKAKSKRTQYVDQPQDSRIIKGVRYRTWRLQVGYDTPIPDYVSDLMEAIIDLDSVFINGNQYTPEVDAEWEYQEFAGEPKVIQFLDIRQAENSSANVLNTSGKLTGNFTAGYVINPAALGQSLEGQDLIQVTNS